MGKRELTDEQAFQIAQAAATMAIEDMPFTKEDYRNAADIITGKKTADQVAAEITKRYKNAGKGGRRGRKRSENNPAAV